MAAITIIGTGSARFCLDFIRDLCATDESLPRLARMESVLQASRVVDALLAQPWNREADLQYR